MGKARLMALILSVLILSSLSVLPVIASSEPMSEPTPTPDERVNNNMTITEMMVGER